MNGQLKSSPREEVSEMQSCKLNKGRKGKLGLHASEFDLNSYFARMRRARAGCNFITEYNFMPSCTKHAIEGPTPNASQNRWTFATISRFRDMLCRFCVLFLLKVETC